MKILLLFLATFFTFSHFAQDYKAVVVDELGDPMIGVRIETSDGQQQRSDFDGNFQLQINSFPIEITFSFMDYETLVLKADRFSQLPSMINMQPNAQTMDAVVVSASRRRQRL